MAGDRCSSTSVALGEPMDGTASTVTNWLLIEQPGPWGDHAVIESRLPRRVAGPLLERSREAGVRVILLRRHGGGGEEGRNLFLAHIGPDEPWLEHTVISDVRLVLDVDLAALGAGRPTGLSRENAPLFLVCTNGRRDPCCAERGRPVARALTPIVGERVWECSHIGGDRFAGNLVCFPRGDYFGRLDATIAPDVALAYLGGAIDLERYRGRSCYPFAVQAAEAFLRRELGLTGFDDLMPIWEVRSEDRGEDTLDVQFEDRSKRRTWVRVQALRDGPTRPLTCHSTSMVAPPRYVAALFSG